MAAIVQYVNKMSMRLLDLLVDDSFKNLINIESQT